MTVDGQLENFARAAEAGAGLPRVWLIANGTVCSGLPTTTAWFVHIQQEHHQVAWAQWAKKRPRQAQAAEPIDPAASAAQAIAPLRAAAEQATAAHDPAGALCIRGAQVWPMSGGNGLAIPAIRIPLHAVTGWWIDGASELKAKTGGGWWAGVAVPLDWS